jgi:hypothetical protein
MGLDKGAMNIAKALGYTACRRNASTLSSWRKRCRTRRVRLVEANRHCILH